VVVASTGGAAGARDDTTGPVIAEWLAAHGYSVDAVTVVADADVAPELSRVLGTAPAVIITTGGTGASPTDQTPEATSALLDRELPGIAEAIRGAGLAITPTAALSRGLAGTANGTVIVNLPGSPGGVRDGLTVLHGLLDHLVAQIAGGGPHA
jgi:cyclic pyranopterin phosphate synthase